MSRSIDWRGRVALVTGASSGIGEAMARALARRGARVALTGRRASRLDAIAGELVRDGLAARAHPCDVRDPVAIARTAAAVREAMGGIDLLVNAAGRGRHELFVDHSATDIEDMMQTNYMGTVHWIKQVLPGMRERGRGWIVNVSSFAGRIGQADEVAYSASKFAVSGLSQGLAQELAPDGVHVLCVHPTLVRTEMFTPEVLARMPDNRPGFMSPEDFARQTLRALDRGRREAVIPARMRGPIVLNALFPEWMGRMVGRVKLAALRRAGVTAP